MMNKWENPFNTGSPADPDEFFGRANILNEIFKFLANKNQNTFLINGVRRIGKTSLLRKIQREILDQQEAVEKGYLPVYFDLQNKGEMALPEVLYELMQAVNVELNISDDFEIKDFKENFEIFEKEYLKSILKTKKNIVILFDEFDALGERKFIAEDDRTKHLAYVQFVPYLQKIIEKNLSLKFIFAIGRSLGDLAEYYGPIKKFSQVAELTYFELNESKELIEHLTENTISYPGKAIEKIHQITAGYPYLLQCLASFLFDNAVENDTNTINPDEIDQYVVQAAKKYSGGLTWFWEGFKPEEKVYLFIIANLMEERIKVTEKTIIERLNSFKMSTFSPKYVNVLNKLTKSKIIDADKKPKCYKIVVPLIQKWILTEHTIESFREDIRNVDKIVQRYLDLGKILMEEEEYEDAIETFRKVLKRDPENFDAQYNLAFSLNIISEDESTIINEFEKAFKLNPVYVKDSYVGILNKFYEKSKDDHYLRKILGINKNDINTQRRLLDHIFEKWRIGFSNGNVTPFTNSINSDKWIIEYFVPETENFIEKCMEEFMGKEKYELVINLFNLIPDKLNINRFYKWFSKALNIENEKAIEKAKYEGYNIGYKKGKEEGYEKGEKTGFEEGKKVGFEIGEKAGFEKGMKKVYDEKKKMTSDEKWEVENVAGKATERVKAFIDGAKEGLRKEIKAELKEEVKETKAPTKKKA